ncbi:MAG TPA: DUF192 domain-containing protein [Acidimicrobiales bacterium]|nr:DUF192 domain-containing protein [Acidimicrobiales bacterium]
MTKGRPRSPHRPRPLLVGVLGWVVVIVLLSAVGALLAVGANGPKDPRLVPTGSVGQEPIAAEFGAISFTLTPAAGAVPPAAPEHCGLSADTEAERQRGLMGQSGLGGYDAMVFRFDTDTSGTFYMRNVPVPLSIAWFDGSGRFVSSNDMAPCPDQEGCPQYPAAGPYRFALEVEKGGLERLGVSTDSVLTLGETCAGPDV